MIPLINDLDTSAASVVSIPLTYTVLALSREHRPI